MNAAVVSAGEPDEAVTWSLEQTAEGVSLSDEGLLTVGAQVADGTKLQIKATSVFDTEKSDTYEITVKANKIVGVTVKAAGDKDTISTDLPLNLSATVDNGGTTAATDVTWSLVQEIEGVSLSAKGKNATLTVSEDVAADTNITVCATSVFDPTKKGELTVTVQKDQSDVFDLNKLSVDYWEDFSVTSTTDALAEGGVVSYQMTAPTNQTLADYAKVYPQLPKFGIYIMDDNLSTTQKQGGSLALYFGSREDYLQFELSNEGKQEKTVTLSFMLMIQKILRDDDFFYDISQLNDYKLPLKLVALDESGNETILQSDIQIPYPCDLWECMSEWYECSATVKVPAGKTIHVQLKMNADLPGCFMPDDDTKCMDEPHPVAYKVDNIVISSGDLQTIEMTVGESYQLEGLNTVEGDTVTYYTNSRLAQYAHEEDQKSNNEYSCTRFATTIADVNSTGKITANKAGDTALIAEIKHENGEIERKQCIIHVKEAS